MADIRPAPEAQLKAYDGSSAFDLLKTIAGFDAAGSSFTGLLAAIAPDRRYSSVSLGTAANSTQEWDCGGAGDVVVYVGTSTTGTLTFEATADGTNWVAVEMFDEITDLWVSGTNLTPTSGKVYRLLARGYRKVRARTVSLLGATVSLVANVTSENTMLTGVDVGHAPHSIGYLIVNKAAQYTTTQTGTALWTPASGKRIVVTSYQIDASGTTAGDVQLWFGASADTTYTRGTDSVVFDGGFKPSSTLRPGVVQSGCWVADAADRVLRVTDSAAINALTVNVWGYETV